MQKASKSRRRQIKKSNAEIRKILWEQWDPIGVNENLSAFGEYDSYARSVHTLLLQDASEAAIVEHLYRIETETMGLAGSSEAHLKRVASVLRNIQLD